MRKFAIILATLVGCFGVTTSPIAHHSYAAYDRCAKFTVAGEIEEIVWSAPHVVLSVRDNSGSAYRVEWFTPARLARAGIRSEQLMVGQRVQIDGSKHADPAVNIVTLVTSVQRIADGWQWRRAFPVNPPQPCS